MSSVRAARRELKRQNTKLSGARPGARISSDRKSFKVAVLTMIIGFAAYTAAIATSAASARGSPDASLANGRNVVAVHLAGSDQVCSGGLTIREKSHRACSAGSFHSAGEGPDVFAELGVKGDRLAASACEWNFPNN